MPAGIDSQRAVSDANEFVSLVVKNMSDLVAVVDTTGKLLYASPSYAALLGTAASTQGSDIFAAIHPLDRPRMQHLVRETARTGRGEQTESRWVAASGAMRRLTSRTDALKDEQGNVTKVLIVSRESAEYVLPENALFEPEKHFRSLVESATDWIWEVDSGGVYTFASPKVRDFLGYEPDEVLGKTRFDFIVPEERDLVRENFFLLMKERKPFFHLETRNLHKHNRIVVLETNGVPTFDANGTLKGYRGIDRDVTGHHAAEHALQESEERYRSLVELSPDGILIHTDGRCVYANNAFVRMMRAQSAEDLHGRAVLDFVHSSYRNIVRQRIQHSLALHEQMAPLEQQFVRLDGSVFFVEVASMPFTFQGRAAAQVVVRDITDRKRAEAALRESEQKHRTLFETMVQGVVYQDSEGKILSANPAAEKILGITFKQMQGRRSVDPVWRVVHEDGAVFPGDTHPAMIALKSGREVRNVVMGVLYPGENDYRWINVSAIPLYRPGESKPYQVYATFDDITQHKRMDEALRKSEERFRRLVERSADAVAIIDKDGAIVYESPADQNVSGYRVEERLGKNAFDLVNPDDKKRAESIFAEIAAKPGSSRTEVFRILHKDGSWRWVEVTGTNHLEEPAIRGILVNYRDITSRRKAEDNLRQTQARLETIVTRLPVVFFGLDSSGTFTFSEGKGLEALGLRPGEVVGKSAFELYREFPAIVQAIKEAIAGNVLRQVHDMGELVFDVQYTPLRGENGSTIGVLGVASNITEQKRAENGLRESNEKLQSLIQTSPVAIVLIDAEARTQLWNPAATRMFGWSEAEVIGRPLPSVPEEKLEEHRALGRRLIEGKGFYDQILHRRRKDGSPVVISASAEPVRDANARIVGAICVMSDITERQRAEDALKQSEQRFRDLADSLPETVFEIDRTGKVLFTNKTGLVTFGYTAAEVLEGVGALSLIIPEERPRAFQNLLAVLRGEHLGAVEYTGCRKDGARFPIRIHSTPILKEGTAVGLRGIIVNTTEQKQAEEERARLNSAVEQAAESIVITDVAGTILYVNPAFERITGYQRAEALGKTPRILRSGKHDVHFYREMWATLMRGEVWSGYVTNKRRDGSLFEEEMVISPVRDAAGAIVNFVAVKRDVTHEREIEYQLRQSQKMESLGQLASGIAHDFNNVLGVILGSLSLLEKRVDNEDLVRYIEMGKTAANRGAEVAARLLTFCRAEKTQLVPLSFGDIVDELIGVLRHSFEKTVVIRKELSGKLPIIHGDHGQLYQMLLNLCINGRDAMVNEATGASEGTLTIGAGTRAGSEVRNRFGEASATRYLEISVTDTGAGMTEAVKQRIFEPFFTTKPIGKGTGLGLSVVYGIVKSHNGFMDVHSGLNQGTTFVISFPVLDAEEGKISKTEQRKIRGGTETVLVVEDEEPLRLLCSDLLALHGYTVYAASDGFEAIEMYRKHQNEIAVVVTDMGLPKLSGAVVFARIREINPHARIILASGYMEPHLKSKLFVSGAKAFLQKPYDPGSMLEVLREVLDAQM